MRQRIPGAADLNLDASQETFLFADYPDPFIPEPDSLDEIVTKNAVPGTPGGGPATASPMAPSTPPKPPPPPTLQSFLQYLGMIGNPGKKLKIAIINLHGKELLVKEKETRRGAH